MKLYSASDDKLSKLFVTPEQKKKEHIGTRKKAVVKKKVVKASIVIAK
jgi:hypothetical protein